MKNIRKDLIEKELQNSKDFKYIKLSNRFIDWLFNHYYCNEVCENFYDSEPEIDECIGDLAYIYKYHTKNGINKRIKKYIKEKYGVNYTNEIGEKAFIDRENIFKKYKKSEERLTFCNWQEPYFEGNWGMTQKYVDGLAKYLLKKEIRNFKNLKERLFIRINKEDVVIYFYGRDIIEHDYWFIFSKKRGK